MKKKINSKVKVCGVKKIGRIREKDNERGTGQCVKSANRFSTSYICFATYKIVN